MTDPEALERELKTDWFDMARELAESAKAEQAAKAERDAFALVIQQVRDWCQEFNTPEAEPYSFSDEMLTVASSLFSIIDAVPSDALAAHDAEVLTQAASAIESKFYEQEQSVEWLLSQAAAYREDRA